ncbi:tubulin beta chain, putative [Entamoeba invadens IP1]|uniref:Tubulin beta chain n=1 Tax=Entamoeba invadens IP1 TaxID=370355 RepID=A0A0A1UFJ5_ENTIV|nr:tubulin beta chain, putative [Entamoeba invadens IP1]ELP92709.1 tubulin beta chain, putative [Entamoeba invadens IP1]|eukprot:XP_004259480.1 tubulin beta chain, putative [Entamoeba invadens IP1]
MREIISLQIGQCGNQVGEKFWDLVNEEHNISPVGEFTGTPIEQQRLSVYYTESSTKRYVPRTTNVDLEPGTINALKVGKLGGLFRPDSFVCGKNGAGNNWGKGHYTDGLELCERVMEFVRKEAEACDCLQGFQITHSLGGGTGSGLGTLIQSKLREEYFDKVISTFSVMPSPTISETVVEPYNCMLSLHSLLESAGVSFCFDNEALNTIAKNITNKEKPSYENLNCIVASVMSGITCSLRFPGQLNQDLRKLYVNMIPYTRLRFLTSSIAPVASALEMEYQSLSVSEIIPQLFERKNMMVDFNPQNGRYLTASCIMRGNVSTHDVEENLFLLREKNTDVFCPWIPNNVQLAVCDVPPKKLKVSGTLISNSTGMVDLFDRIYKQFVAMFTRKAFVYLYTEEGMEESEFLEAGSDIADLIKEYKQYHSAEPQIDQTIQDNTSIASQPSF